MEDAGKDRPDSSTDVYRDDESQGAIVSPTPIEEGSAPVVELVAVQVDDVNALKERTGKLRSSMLESRRHIGDGMRTALIELGLWE